MNDSNNLPLEIIPDFPSLERIFQHLASYIAEPKDSKPQPLRIPLSDFPDSLLELQELFGLTIFECQVLLLCLLPFRDARASMLLAAINQNERFRAPTPGAVLALFSTNPNQDQLAFLPSAPLVRFGLLQLEGHTTGTPELFLTPRAFQFLTNDAARVQNTEMIDWFSIEPVLGRAFLEPQAEALTKAQKLVLERMRVFGLRHSTRLCLFGGDTESRRAVLGSLCFEEGLFLHVIPISEDSFPSSNNLKPRDGLDTSIQTWVTALTREARLQGTAFLLELQEVSPRVLRCVTEIFERSEAVILVSSREALQLEVSSAFVVQSFELPFAKMEDQSELWLQALTNIAPQLSSDKPVSWQTVQNRVLARVLNFMTLNASMIARAAREALTAFLAELKTLKTFSRLETDLSLQDALEELIWNAARAQVRVKLDALPVVERVTSSTSRADLVFSPKIELAYEQILKQVRLARVARTRGVIAGERGSGVTVLFSGVSGTGKTTTAEALARDLNLDLYRVKLSETQSKFIGETNKNLDLLFDAAQFGGVVLLFDEADALFGKRGAVQDSHDRYANSEVNYLLQAIEIFQGLAILTTNLETSIDEAFQRRLRFIVRFDFPTKLEREQIWKRILPESFHPELNPDSDLNFSQLAQLELTGANIKNITLHAGFTALEPWEHLTMLELFHTARAELRKQGISWNWSWITGWDLPPEILEGIPDESIFASTSLEALRGVKALFSKADIDTVTSKSPTREWFGSITETVLNIYCFDSRPNLKLERQLSADKKHNVTYFDFFYHVFAASKNDDERLSLNAKVIHTISSYPSLPDSFVPSAGGFRVRLRMGDAEEQAQAFKATSHLDVPSEGNLVFAVSVPMKLPWKGG